MKVLGRVFRVKTVGPGQIEHSLMSRLFGQSQIEYALIMLAVAILLIALLMVEGKQLQNIFSNLSLAFGS